MKRLSCAIVIGFTLLANASGHAEPIYSYTATAQPVVGKHGMVASQSALATKVGIEVLKQGGNAIDAAVAVGFALAVTLPRAGNIGGGGFMLVHRADADKPVAIDYREKAPALARRDMFLDRAGNADPQKSRASYLAVGVPGTVAGLALALEKYGTISLAQALAPAIQLAENGIIVDADLHDSLERARPQMQRYPESMRIFFKANGKPYQMGERLVQRDLAKSLRLIAQQGSSAFYRGKIAAMIAADMKTRGGLVTLQDLREYQPVVREPIQGNYRGFDVYSMPPPSSGGVHLVQMLNILQGFDLAASGHNSAATIHTMVEAMKMAYADRSKYLGDPDFSPVPVQALLAADYAAKLRRKIHPKKATPSKQIAPGLPLRDGESNETTHFSIVDDLGNCVSNTYTLNFSYGMKAVAKGTGILLNNEMDDFSAKPGVPNAYGLLGGSKNAVAPHKRMLSSMTPTIVLRQGRPFLVTGSPGGSRIITTTLQIVVNVIDHKMNVAEATNAVRIHHQWLPDVIWHEKGLSHDTIERLGQLGHKMKSGWAMGSTQSILIKNGMLFGASDLRKPGALTQGF